MERGWYGAFATLIGTTIGAGIFGIPYVVAKAGFWTGILVIILVGIIVCVISLYLSEILLRTKEHHQLPGLAEIYLGKTGKLLMSSAMIIGIYGALIAYSIGVGEALFSVLNLNKMMISILFISIFGFIMYFGLKIFEGFEEILTSLVILLVTAIAILSFASIKPENLSGFNLKNIFIPYGVILFASLGIYAIPEMKKELTNKLFLKRAIITGISVAVIVYIIFTTLIVGITGSETTEVASVGLGNKLGGNIRFLVNIFVVLPLTTAFLSLSFALKDSYKSDYKINNFISWLMVIIVPVIFTLVQLVGFVRVMEISAVVGDGLMLTLITIMHSKAKKLGVREPEFTIYGPWWIKAVFIGLFVTAVVITLM